jgi:hypothetical protein
MDMPEHLRRIQLGPSRLGILAPSVLAVLCFAAPVGTFDDESNVAEIQKPGHAAFNSVSGEYAITGTGDIGGTSDGFHYVWKKMTGDIVIGADIRFTSEAVAGEGKAALMIRQTLDPRAPYAAAVLRDDGRAAFQYRSDTGATSKSAELAAKEDLTSTVYVLLERQGDAFTMSAGKRGKRAGQFRLVRPLLSR